MRGGGATALSVIWLSIHLHPQEFTPDYGYDKYVGCINLIARQTFLIYIVQLHHVKPSVKVDSKTVLGGGGSNNNFSFIGKPVVRARFFVGHVVKFRFPDTRAHIRGVTVHIVDKCIYSRLGIEGLRSCSTRTYSRRDPRADDDDTPRIYNNIHIIVPLSQRWNPLFLPLALFFTPTPDIPFWRIIHVNTTVVYSHI